MTTSHADARPLTAVDTLTPSAGDVVDVLEGEMLVFSLSPDGRRTPLCTVAAGSVVVGCSPADEGETLLVTGLPGTQVRTTTLDSGQSHAGQLQEWVDVLGSALTQGRWPGNLITIASAGSMLAPGRTSGPSAKTTATSGCA